MNLDRIGQLYRPYLPGWLRPQISAGHVRSGSVYTCTAVVLYADLSGFTRLTAAFASLPDGAERLHDLLNHSYSVLIDTVNAHQGDVAAIAGDALTAWWPETQELAVAQRCATALQATLAALPAITTPDGLVRLDLRIGISVGLIHVALVGLPSYGVHPVFFGPALAAATAAERNAAPGTITYAPPTDPGYSRVRIPGDGPPLTWAHFLPPNFGARLRLNDLGAEYRRCVPAFCAFELPEHPADVHRFVTQVQAVVMRWGGWLNEVEVGDKGAVLVLLFGAPVARGDDTSRAVGCCLELRSRNLIDRAGISVGFLFVGAVGSPLRRVYTAQGDDMNLAAHLMQLARPGTLLVSSYVRQETLGRYQTSTPWVISTKGHTEGVPVAEVISAPHRSIGSASLQRYLGASGPLIGRNAEREQISTAAQAAVAGHARLILIEGESGIGKTALIQDLVQYWYDQGLTGFGSEGSSGAHPTPLLAWRPILLDLCGIDESAPIEQRRAAFQAALASLPHRPSGRTALAALLGITDYTQSDLTPDGVQLAAALIAAHLQDGPLLLVIEDMQWADPATWRLAQYLLTMGDPEQPWPLCLVLAHRPLDGSTQAEVTMLHRHPATERVILGPLDADASNELCRRLLNVSYVEPHLAQHVIRHTEGQPLFIREYLRVLAQHSLIEITDGSAHLREGSPSVQAAYSAQGVIQARVDRLDEPTRLTLKIAAVIGRSFPLHLLAAIHPTQPDEATLRRQLDQLHLQQIIDLELGDPEPVYRFKHGITHEVAYNSLLFGQRRQLHAQIARWYAQTHAAALRSHLAPLAVYDVLIAHLRRAEEWDATVHACHEATLCALRQNSTGAALRSIEQALVLTTNADIRSTLLLLRLSIHERIGSLGSQGDTLREALDLTAHIAHPLLHTYAQVLHVVYLLTIGEPISAIRQVRYLYRQLHGRNLPPDQVRLLQICLIDLRGAARLQHGVPAHAARLHRIALRKAQELLANPPPPLVPGLFALPALILRCLNNLGDALLALEQLKSALECHRQALKLAQTHSDWYAEARARQGLSAVYLAYGADNEAHTQAMRGLTTSHAIADRAGQTLALRQLAAISANRGDYAEAQRQAWHALAISTSTQARALERELLHAIAAYATAQGQYEEAAAARQEALREQ